MLNRVCIRRQHYQCCCLCIQVTFLCLGLLYASFCQAVVRLWRRHRPCVGLQRHRHSVAAPTAIDAVAVATVVRVHRPIRATGGRLDRHYSYKVTGAPGVMGCRRLPILRLRACVDFTSLIRRHLLLVCASLQVVWALKDPTLRGVPIVALSYRPLLNQIAVLAHNVRLRGSSTSTVLTVPHLPWSAWQQPWCNRL